VGSGGVDVGMKLHSCGPAATIERIVSIKRCPMITQQFAISEVKKLSVQKGERYERGVRQEKTWGGGATCHYGPYGLRGGTTNEEVKELYLAANKQKRCTEKRRNII